MFIKLFINVKLTYPGQLILKLRTWTHRKLKDERINGGRWRREHFKLSRTLNARRAMFVGSHQQAHAEMFPTNHFPSSLSRIKSASKPKRLPINRKTRLSKLLVKQNHSSHMMKATPIARTSRLIVVRSHPMKFTPTTDFTACLRIFIIPRKQTMTMNSTRGIIMKNEMKNRCNRELNKHLYFCNEIQLIN